MVELRRMVLLPLDDLLAITREFINAAVSRSGLDRCLRRHGVSDLKSLLPQAEGETAPLRTFKDCEPGFVHIDIKYLPQMHQKFDTCLPKFHFPNLGLLMNSST